MNARSPVHRGASRGHPALPDDAVHPLTPEAWRAWLAEHHGRATGVWLVSYKRATGRPRIAYEAAVEEALCFGWVDSKPRKLDDERTMLYFAPRRPGSGWSRPNKERVARLEAAGRMAPAGAAKVAAARRDGTWEMLDAIEALEIPEDLAAALQAAPDAALQFEAFPRSAKRGILEWIAQAKTEATRRKRVEETARLASRGVRANQWRRR